MHATAYADQFTAAATNARRVLLAATAAGVGRPGTEDLWLRAQISRFVRDLTTGRVHPCPHIGVAPAVAQAALWLPRRLFCPPCAPALRPDTVEDSTCDQCRRPSQRIHAGMVAIGPILLAYGRCDHCAPNSPLRLQPS